MSLIRRPAIAATLACLWLTTCGGSEEEGEGGESPVGGGASGPFVKPVRLPQSVLWAVGDGADGAARGRAVAKMIE